MGRFMSQTKRLLERAEMQGDVALKLALQAGALRKCEFHGDFFAGAEDVQWAYRLANSKFSKGELRDAFDTPREMTDTIKGVVDFYPAEECPRCLRLDRE
jgi:hypothetical protein